MPTVLTLQSSVSYGHVGNSAATFALMRLGVEAVSIPTVLFSNHTGYGRWRGRSTPVTVLRELVLGLDELGVLSTVDAVVTGYLGDEALVNEVATTVATVRQRNPAAWYCCDPVVGDEGTGVFVRPGIAELIRNLLLPVADLATPNRFELGLFADAPTETVAEVVAAAHVMRRTGPRSVLVTSVRAQDAERPGIGTAVVTQDASWLATTPRLDRTFAGAGDLSTAVFLARLLSGMAAPDALELTAAATYGVLLRTADRRELALVDAQQELVAPTYRCQAVRISGSEREGQPAP